MTQLADFQLRENPSKDLGSKDLREEGRINSKGPTNSKGRISSNDPNCKDLSNKHLSSKDRTSSDPLATGLTRRRLGGAGTTLGEFCAFLLEEGKLLL